MQTVKYVIIVQVGRLEHMPLRPIFASGRRLEILSAHDGCHFRVVDFRFGTSQMFLKQLEAVV